MTRGAAGAEGPAGADDRTWVVDRIEGETVVLIDDTSGRTAEVARSAIGVQVREGTVLRVPVSTSGTLAWLSARADDHEGSTREHEARDILDDLRGRDPGGDVDV